MDMSIPPLKIKIMLESNPPKSRILVQRLSVGARTPQAAPLARELLCTMYDMFMKGFVGLTRLFYNFQKTKQYSEKIAFIHLYV